MGINFIFLEPAFYDLFGILFFSFLIFISLRKLRGKELNDWVFRLILIVGVLGFLVDITMVLMNFVF